MFFIPTTLTNILLLATCWLSGIQLSRLKLANPVPSIQFLMILFCMVIAVVVTLYNKVNPWLSEALFVVAVVSLGVMIRQNRMMPPMKPFQ